MAGDRAQRIAIVGGGPAGSTCAARLAAGGCTVDLFEARPTGEKPCGGGIPGAAMREFPVLLDPTLSRRIVTRVVLYAPSGRSVEVPARDGIHIFSRQEMDGFLRAKAREAGATVIETTVRGIERDSSGRWSLTTDDGTHEGYDFLVGADGVRGIVRRALVGRPPESTLTLARYAYTGPARDEMRAQDLVLKFLPGSDGYAWIFPRKDHLSIGICATQANSSATSLERDLTTFMESSYPEAATGAGPVKGYFIPADPAPPHARQGERWALIGDAGGFVDPITREGIAPAMRSAATLSESILGQGRHVESVTQRRATNGTGLSLGSSPATPPLPRHLQLAHAYRQGFFREEFLERMVQMASRSGAIRRILGDLFSGRQGYEGLKRRLILNALPAGVQIGYGALLGRRSPSGISPSA